MAIREPQARPGAGATDGDSRTFTGLVNRLVGDILRLLDQKLALLKLELREELAAVVRRSAFLAVGALLAAFGGVFLCLALAIWVGELVGSTSAGFGIVGGTFAVGGGLLLVIMRRRLAAQRLVPEQTVQELRRDVQWIKHEL